MGLIKRLIRRPIAPTPSPGAELPPGIVIQWPGETPPAGFIKLNGAGVEVALYPELDAALWVGSSRNATAEAFYRFTSLGDPSGSRATLGAYLKLLDMRAQFARGWDDGRGVDAGRAIASSQAGSIESHAHPFGGVNLGFFVAAGGTYGGYMNPRDTGLTGGGETRPRNTALLFCIKI